ncbi:MAG: alpha/beta fold hydrolase [Sphingomonadales bacterium]|nr:MAG: alpha/beta fold hydrolase [Sphingomonadales bacterium]
MPGCAMQRTFMSRFLTAIACLALSACAAAPQEAPQTAQVQVEAPAPVLTLEPYVFTAANGTKVDAEKGTFEVPENRAKPNSRKIKISFIRFKSTSATPGDPIVYLAGGPGAPGSRSLMGGRFPLTMALREVGDVIAYDQRGTGGPAMGGLSNTVPVCQAAAPFDTTQPITRATITAYTRAGLTKCFAEWEEKGVEIDGYTTLQNAHDLEDLRRALGAKKLNLWGISYGSHLGLAMMKYHGGSVNKAVLSGIEGLDQTIKRPAMTDRMFVHVQDLIDADPAAKAVYPDVAGMIRRVTAKLKANPAVVTFTPAGASAPVTITFDAYPLQLATAGSIADPSGIATVPMTWLALDKGDLEPAARRVYAMAQGLSMFRGMPEAMDVASGATAGRLALITQEAETSLLADALNFPMPHVMGVRPQIDAGDAFRAPFSSNVPALFISSTLDGRTYPDEAAEEIKGFANGQRLIVENGGHNIYEADPRIADAVVAYFKGQPAPARIVMPPPKFAIP